MPEQREGANLINFASSRPVTMVVFSLPGCCRRSMQWCAPQAERAPSTHPGKQAVSLVIAEWRLSARRGGERSRRHLRCTRRRNGVCDGTVFRRQAGAGAGDLPAGVLACGLWGDILRGIPPNRPLGPFAARCEQVGSPCDLPQSNPGRVS